MKKMLRTGMSFILAFVLAFTAVMPANAARPGTKFLSELHMAEAKDADTAKKMLTDAGYTVFNKNLNPNGDTAVYLGYKTSTDVEDAITDISVMNMNGGFNITDYETSLKESFEEYKDMVIEFRTAANEFAANYEKGTKEAKLAYRQLNYYYDEQPVLDENGEKVLDEDGNVKTVITKMGDYMLAFPEKDEDFANILFKGNTNILDNIRSLLAMGVANGNLVSKINEAIAIPENFEKIEHYEIAKKMLSSFLSISKMKTDAETEIESIKNDETLTDEEKDTFSYNPYQAIVQASSIENMLRNIPYGETNYYEYIETSATVDYSALYPFVEAMTPGQRALVTNGQLIPVLIYSEVETTEEELEEQLSEFEETYLEQSVYLGTDMELFEGSFALTKGAINRENTTGDSWIGAITGNEAADVVLSGLVSAGGVALATASAKYLLNKINIAQEFKLNTARINELTSHLRQAQEAHTDIVKMYQQMTVLDGKVVQNDLVRQTAQELADQKQAYTQYMAQTHVSGGAVALSSLGMALGLGMIAFGIYSIVRIVNSYNVEYTDIPTNMVENVETENGDRYIRYSVVNSYYMDDDEVKTKAGDTNGYEGKQWNALYYTKNYEAGKCMLANADWPTTEADYGKYAPVHPFGQKTVCCDLNDFTDEDDADEIYLAFRTSNTQKAAAASVPTVVGTAFNYGMLAISAVVGIGIGMGIMAIVKRKKGV